MAKRELNIRGGLGVQVFEYLVGLARVPEGQDPLKYYDKVCVNIGGGDSIIDHSRTMWLDQVFDIDVPVKAVNGIAKQRAWLTFNFQQIVDKDVIQLTKLKRKVEKNDFKILHIRGRDRSLVSVDQYTKLAEKIGPEVKFLTNEPTIVEDIIDTLGYGEDISSDSVNDWYTCVGAKEIHGGLSGFTITAMLYDPLKPYHIFSKENSQGRHEVADELYDSLEVFKKHYFKNMEWI